MTWTPWRFASPVDLGAALAVGLALVGVIWSPKLSNNLARATGNLQPVRVGIDVRGIPVADPQALLKEIEAEGRVSLVIRNQPHGTVPLRQVVPLQRKLVAVQPDGRVVAAADPNQSQFGQLDARFILAGQGRRTGGGVVLGNQNLKIGTPVELEGARYRVNGTVTAITAGS